MPWLIAPRDCLYFYSLVVRHCRLGSLIYDGPMWCAGQGKHLRIIQDQSQTSLYDIQVRQKGLTRFRDVGLGHCSIRRRLNEAMTQRIAGAADAAGENYIIARICIGFLNT